MVTIRKALKKDASAIRALIWMVQINPFGLNWRHFLVAVDEQEQVVATGQIKPHHDGTRELASIATHPGYRGQGLASDIIRRLADETERPIYLHCQERMGPFYARFGFRRLDVEEMPGEYAREIRALDFFRKWMAKGMAVLWVMRLD